ncbi:MAG: hypothetical protein ACREIQ_06425 [Nitrospiria bacterium]
MKYLAFLPLLLGGILLIHQTGIARAAEQIQNTASLISEESEDPEANSKILVEIFLAVQQKENLTKIKKEFEAFSITRVKGQFFRLGNPPENIAIGRNITAPVARLAIQMAITYNRGIKYLLPEERLSPNYIAIGTSMFDESFQIPISPEDLKRLSDPALTTPEFHTLYRHLTREDRRP